MDNLFATNWDYSTEHNLTLINALTSPSQELHLNLNKEDDKQRRVSAPSAPSTSPLHSMEANNGDVTLSGNLWIVKEEEEEDEKEKERERRKLLLSGAVRTSLIQSHSMDDMKQLETQQENTSLHITTQDFHTQLMSLRTTTE